MSVEPSCCSCRSWVLLREGAVIGRCRDPQGGAEFCRPTFCCPQWEPERRITARDEAVADDALADGADASSAEGDD